MSSSASEQPKTRPSSPLWFWLPWSVDALIAAVAVYFLFVGLTDGSVSSFNIGLWMMILLGLAVIVGGSIWLRTTGTTAIAIALLLVLAIPGLLGGLLLLALIVARPDFK
jgi:hypothetical protein